MACECLPFGVRGGPGVPGVPCRLADFLRSLGEPGVPGVVPVPLLGDRGGSIADVYCVREVVELLGRMAFDRGVDDSAGDLDGEYGTADVEA